MSQFLNRVTELPALPPRPADGHKGDFGRVLIVAGSRGMSGAACLAAVSALRGGAGLVTVAVPRTIQPIIAGYEPSYLTLGLAEDADGRISLDALPTVLDALQHQTAAAFGPGLGRSTDLDQITLTIYQSAALPMVIDADGLNALAAQKDRLAATKPAGPRVFTPHPGEFARLTGRSAVEINHNREELAAGYARQHGVVVLLKGAHTVITDGQRVAINTTGNSGMATGGCGDVLTGLITALLAQGMPAFDAAQLGACLHGMAGDLAAAELSNPGLIASDLPKYLAFAWRKLGR